MSTSTIQHIVAMPVDVQDRGESLFQGFSLALHPDYSKILTALISFPHDLLESSLAGEHFVNSKMSGSSLNIRMIRADLIDENHVDLRGIATVIWSTSESVSPAEDSLAKFQGRPLHLTLGRHTSAVSIEELSNESIYRHLLALADRVSAAIPSFKLILDRMRRTTVVAREEGLLPFVPKLHNCTMPMAETLRLYGYNLDNGTRVEPSEGIEEHVSGMLEMSNLIDRLRRGHPAEVVRMRKNDGIIFCPSLYAFMYRVDEWNKTFRTLSRQQKNLARNFLLRNKGYSNGQIRIEGGLENPYGNPILGTMLAQRQFELHHFTIIVAILSANQFVSALRLPNGVNLHHDILSEISYLFKSRKKNRMEELSRRIAQYSEAILADVGKELLDAAFANRERLLLICDLPLEWLSIDLVPLMFRCEISRIPSTPGNVLSNVALSSPRIIIPYKALTKVRVIRSFESSDPIREHLFLAIERFALEKVEVQFVDVQTSTELIDAMNNFDGALLIFDCHGDHGGKSEHAWLHIGRERVDVWQLANVARMPPIVLLAACSTHPLDGSHASVANGFLRSGVLSVLGTFAPVDSVHTAILVARLLHRIDAFVPLLTARGQCSWREIVSVFLRMSYATDVFYDLAEEGRLNDEQKKRCHLNANLSINSGASDWIEEIQRSVMDSAGMGEGEMKDLWRRRFQFVPTMLFTQLGRPENILVEGDQVISRSDL